MSRPRTPGAGILPLAFSIFAFFFVPSAFAVPVYEKDELRVNLSGHLQELTSSTEDPVFEEHVTENTSRARLTFRVLTGTMVSFEASLDGTYTFGSVLQSPLFILGKHLDPPTFYDLEQAYLDEDGRYGEASVYRAMVTLEAEKYRVVIGRQRLAYGTALFWSPIDIWNPASPLSLEPEEKTGVDGVSGIWWITDKISATALAGLADEWDEAKAAASVGFQVKTYTFDVMAGKRFQDQVYGMDFVGYLGDAGVRGEFTYTVADKRDDYERGVLGMDYAWPSSLYAALEYYHNGGRLELGPLEEFSALLETMYLDPVFLSALMMGRDLDSLIEEVVEEIEEMEDLDSADSFSAFVESSGVETANRNFLAGMVSYDLDPLVKGSLFAVLDLDKGSHMIGPSLTWYAGEHLTVSGGAQVFGGAKDGEFGLYPDLCWLRVRWDY